MNKKFYVCCRNKGLLYEEGATIVPIICSEENLEVVATAIGKGYNADSCVVYDNPNCKLYEPPYKVYWDCM